MYQLTRTCSRLGFISSVSVSVFLMFLAPARVMAQPEEGQALTIGAAVLDFGYQEFSDSGKRLNREDGAIPGLGIGISHSFARWLLSGDFSYHAGDVTYRGQTNTGIPITSHTDQEIVAMTLRIEYWQATTMLIQGGGLGYNAALYLGVGYHDWVRDIQPTRTAGGAPVSGLFEVYQWWLGFMGAKAVLYESRHADWLLDARLIRPVNPSIKVDFKGRYDNIQLNLGERWGVRLALPWRYAISPSTGLMVEPFMESHALGRGATASLTRNGVPVGTVNEPRSESRNYGLVIGINQRF